MSKTYQVVGIGNAIVDVISQSDDSFLDLMGIQKGIMQLVERERGEMLYAGMTNRIADTMDPAAEGYGFGLGFAVRRGDGSQPAEGRT